MDIFKARAWLVGLLWVLLSAGSAEALFFEVKADGGTGANPDFIADMPTGGIGTILPPGVVGWDSGYLFATDPGGGAGTVSILLEYRGSDAAWTTNFRIHLPGSPSVNWWNRAFGSNAETAVGTTATVEVPVNVPIPFDFFVFPLGGALADTGHVCNDPALVASSHVGCTSGRIDGILPGGSITYENGHSFLSVDDSLPTPNTTGQWAWIGLSDGGGIDENDSQDFVVRAVIPEPGSFGLLALGLAGLALLRRPA